MSTRHRVLPLTLAALALALAGCGGSGSTAAPSPSGTSAASGPASPGTPSGAPGPQQSAVAAESSPPGDIPDNIAFVPYRNAAGHYTFTHPEGWAESTQAARVVFTDKLNGVSVEPGPATTPPTVASARSKDVPELQRTQAAFELRSVRAVTVPGGTGVLIVYRRNSAADPVTGRQYRDEVERYELVKNGREVVLEMFGPVGADNVDAYRTMVQSLRIS
jgi:hypothetical protein